MALDLSLQVGHEYAVLLARLVDELVEHAVLPDLDALGLHVAALLGVCVVGGELPGLSACRKLTAASLSSLELLLLLGGAEHGSSLLLLLESLELKLPIALHLLGELSEATVELLLNPGLVFPDGLEPVVEVASDLIAEVAEKAELAALLSPLGLLKATALACGFLLGDVLHLGLLGALQILLLLL